MVLSSSFESWPQCALAFHLETMIPPLVFNFLFLQWSNGSKTPLGLSFNKSSSQFSTFTQESDQHLPKLATDERRSLYSHPNPALQSALALSGQCLGPCLLNLLISLCLAEAFTKFCQISPSSNIKFFSNEECRFQKIL